MQEFDLTADEIISTLMSLPNEVPLCLLDSSASRSGERRLIAGIGPREFLGTWSRDPENTLDELDECLAIKDRVFFFAIAYDLGLKLQNIESRHNRNRFPDAKDITLYSFDAIAIHDYNDRRSYFGCDDAKRSEQWAKLVARGAPTLDRSHRSHERTEASSNFTSEEYIAAVESIRNEIRLGNTYQANLTQQFTIELPPTLTPDEVFLRLRAENPAPFAAFFRYRDLALISSSPERFIRFRRDGKKRIITASPIKGTRPRGSSAVEDSALRRELLESEKDRAENTMIVDLMRNDLGRVCKYGTIRPSEICAIEEHPTVFHLVSTINGELREDVTFTDILRSIFPSGSITGAPKHRTMKIIDEIEPHCRGMSMGMIGYYIPEGVFGLPETLDANVAIRTMTIEDDKAVFNVGGGIVYDSDPISEYNESLLKAKALLKALNATFRDH